MSKIDLRLLEQSLLRPNEPAVESPAPKPRIAPVVREQPRRPPPPPPPRMNRALRPRRRS